MGITVHNATDIALTISDFYIMNPSTEVGCFGVLRYRIPAGGSQRISASKLIREWASQRLGFQQIHVKDGENSLLQWEHDVFMQKDGKVVTIEMVDDVLRERDE